MTKESLTQQNGALSAQVESLNALDKALRERLSKVLDAPKEGDGIYAALTSRGRTTYSWEEIFFEIGKLKLDRTRADVQRFDATLDILLEKLARQSKPIKPEGSEE